MALEPPAGVDEVRPRPWWRRTDRAVVRLALVAVVSLVVGIGLGRLVVNPAEAAARTAPPEAGPITVPVERRELSNDVTLRGDVVFDGAVDLRVETADLAERAVVTGRVPDVGATLDAGSVALEVAGRPVVVLPGGLPTYRTLRAGVSGPDVRQLKEALDALGIGAGDLTSDVYDAAAADGVAALYRHVGYPVPTAAPEQVEALAGAEAGVRAAEAEVEAADRALVVARAGEGAAGIAEADAQVRSAQRDVAVARAALGEREAACAARPPADDCGAAALAGARREVDDAEDRVALAEVARAAVAAGPDTSGERWAADAARRALTEARQQRDAALADTRTPLPAGEVVFLETLPRRVDAVQVQRGGTVEGAVMRASGATLQVEAAAPRADAALLEVGQRGTARVDDVEVAVTVTEVAADRGDGEGDRSTVVLVPDDPTPEQVAALQGRNVRVTLPVSSTGGAVLAVPLAALTAGPGGEARVEVPGEDGDTELVEVRTGLAAGGYVEVDGVDRVLREGELVVVGIAGSADPAPDATAGPSADAG